MFGIKTTLSVDVNNLFNFKVHRFDDELPFNDATNDYDMYLASLHLPMYNAKEYDALRAGNPGLYIPGNDKPGDLRSVEKPYINDPDLTYFYYTNPRDIWFGLRIEF